MNNQQSVYSLASNTIRELGTHFIEIWETKDRNIKISECLPIGYLSNSLTETKWCGGNTVFLLKIKCKKNEPI